MTATRFAAVFLAGAFLATAFFAGTFLEVARLEAAFFAGALLAGARFAVGFLLLAGAFLAVARLATAFLGLAFRAVAFLAVAPRPEAAVRLPGLPVAFRVAALRPAELLERDAGFLRRAAVVGCFAATLFDVLVFLVAMALRKKGAYACRAPDSQRACGFPDWLPIR